jgi:hypothetical protein
MQRELVGTRFCVSVDHNTTPRRARPDGAPFVSYATRVFITLLSPAQLSEPPCCFWEGGPSAHRL